MVVQIFMTIPDDVLIQIFTLVEEANPRTLYNLLFIKSTKSIVETLIYRKVLFRGPRDGWPTAWPPYKLLLERLSDPRNYLGSLVRELTIADWPGPESRDFGVSELETLVRNMKNLAILRWKCSEPIPLVVASNFHTLFPSSLLSVRSRKRGAPAPWGYYWNTAVDLDVRRSLQPLCLDFVAVQNGSKFPIGASPDSGKEVAEFPVLKNILQRSPDVCTLALGCIAGGSYMIGNIHQKAELHNNEDTRLFYKQLRSKDSFPSLKEIACLTKDRNMYYPPGFELSKAQCIAWKTAMNWKALVELDLWNARPNDFFVIFRGHIPQLKILKVRLSLGPEHKEDPAPLLRATARFLDSIDGLEELAISDRSRRLFPGLCPIIARHGHSLMSLDVNPTERLSKYLPGWTAEPLEHLLDSLPKLVKLAIAIDLLKSPGHWSFGVLAWSNNPFSALSSFSNIESIQIRIRLPHTNHNLSPIDHGGVLKMATDTFEAFHKQDTDTQLRFVDVQVQRSSDTFFEPHNSGVTAKARRISNHDERSQSQGDFETEVSVDFDPF
ncbi:hypothetical protein BKA64DRAFT_666206 [Cadophora sp. MPI-SDFR-AT-0126]|nr:hypothetical protein BKA64DRAFT_666206 [Leotiomycetes sp. MPI-SDFR-AT-0126]